VNSVEAHLRPAEVAECLGLDVGTVRKIFEDEPGVVKVKLPALLPRHARRRKPRTFLLIPRYVYERWYASVQSRGFAAEAQARRCSVE
jgi:hypothetical protein